MLKKILTISFWCLAALLYSVYSQTAEQPMPEKTRILFLLDGSGSMLAPWGPNQTRMDVAKRMLAEAVDSLKENPRLELGLRVYGHLFPSKQQNCTDSRLEAAFAPDNHQLIINKLKTIAPKGNTPIAYSLEQSANDFPDASNYRNILILITDGIESCGGDPCAVSLELQKKGIFLKPFVIALGEEAGMDKQFDCLGTSFDASSIEEFKKALRLALKQSLGKTTLTVELLNEESKPTESDVTLTFYNQQTGRAAYNFVHYRDSRGITDTLNIDPVLTYTLQVQTIPPLKMQNITLAGGEHNTLRVKVPQGKLQLNQKNYREYKNGVQAIIRKHKSVESLNVQPMAGTQTYLAGTYDVEVLTLPRTVFRKVEIHPRKTTILELPAPGIANIRADFPGIGDIYELDEDGLKQELIFKLDETNQVNSFPLQPGRYRLVFRSRNAQGSKFTKIRDFEIKEGGSTNLNIFR